jgi:serine/threonine protein kinase
MVDAERYRPLQLLATGGMSELWLAHDRGAGARGRFVALKRMTASARNDRKLREFFVAESRLLAQLQHPNIVQVLDAFEGDDQREPWLALEFLLGADVRTLLARASARERLLPIEAACAIIAGAARGLHFAHQKRDPTGDSLRVVHRDVSPHNLFVTRDGAVKVLDFGIARSAEQQHQTSRTELKGKLGYMAPELLEGRPLDARTDIYGLGIVLWELLTGRRLWHRDHPLMANWATLHELPPPPSELRPEVSAELERLVLQMLARDPSDRPPDAEQVAITLEQQLFALGCASPTDAIRDVVIELAPPAEPSVDLDALATLHSASPSHRPAPSNEPEDQRPRTSLAPPTNARDVSPALTSPASVGEGSHRREGTSLRTRRTLVALTVSTAVLAIFSVSALFARARTKPSRTLEDVARASAATVRLRVVGAPMSARLELDGVAIPADGTVVPSPVARRLRLVDGARTLLEIDRVIDRDLELYVTMTPTDGGGSRDRHVRPTSGTDSNRSASRAPATSRVRPLPSGNGASTGNGTRALPYVLRYDDDE